MISSAHAFDYNGGILRRMVRVKLCVRIIPEDVYIRDIESSTPQPKHILLPQEKRLLQPVDDPQNVSIGLLANIIKSTFRNINHGSVLPHPYFF